MVAEEIVTIPLFNFSKIQLKNFILAQPIYLLPKHIELFHYCNNTRCWHTSFRKENFKSFPGQIEPGSELFLQDFTSAA